MREANAQERPIMTPASGSAAVGEIFNPHNKDFNGVKVFSATMVSERVKLGDKVTRWIEAHPEYDMRGAIVTQSSDEAFHCLAITLFYWEAI